jgi:K+-sensing histidine kinase KdpD
VPLIVRDTTIGVLQIESDVPGRFRPDDAEVLQILADRVALTLEHARVVKAERDARLDALIAQERSRLRDEFIAIAAHELKTPLTALSASAQLALRRMQPSSPAQPLVEQVIAQASKMDRLVLELLESSRIDSGRLTLRSEPVDIAAIITETALSAQRASGHEVRVAAPDVLHSEVDPLRFEQLVATLIDNAVKYSPRERPVEVEVRGVDGSIELAVRDHGAGIPEDERHHLFERFYRGHEHDNLSGLGLGLYIPRAIASAHGGTIAARFPASGGTEFTVRLPIAKSAPHEAEPDAAAEAAP